MIPALLVIASYLLGAIPSGYIAGRLVRGIDLREYGSGNLGATNTFRVLECAGHVPREEMFRAFNLGVGMIAVATANGAEAIVASAAAAGVDAWRLGRVVPGSGRVTLS